MLDPVIQRVETDRLYRAIIRVNKQTRLSSPAERLYALDDPRDHARVLASVLAFEDDARVPYDGYLVTAREEEVAEDGTVGREEREGLFKLRWHWDVCVGRGGRGVVEGSVGRWRGDDGRGGTSETWSTHIVCSASGSGYGELSKQGGKHRDNNAPWITEFGRFTTPSTTISTLSSGNCIPRTLHLHLLFVQPRLCQNLFHLVQYRFVLR